MLHAPTSETKQPSDQARAPQELKHERTLHPRLGTSLTGAWAAATGSGLPLGRRSAQNRQPWAKLQTVHGNQAVLRMLGRSKRAPISTPSSSLDGILQCKCARGGSANTDCAECKGKRKEGLEEGTARASAPLQAKLAVNEPGDPYEQEADHVADQVMRMPDASTRVLQRQCAECAKEGGPTPVLRTPSAAAGHAAAPPIVHEVLRSPGQPLDVSTRAFFERRFAHDFRQVRVHTDTKAAASSRAVQATAYTVGRDVVFADNKYAPTTTAGRRLLAHELTHTIQQEGNGAVGSTLYVGSAPDSSERGAEGAAAALTPAMITPLTVRLSRDQSPWPAWHQEALASIARIAGPSDGKAADDKIAGMMGFLCTMAKDRAQSLHDRLAETAPGMQSGTDDFAVYVKTKFPKNHGRIISVLQDLADGKSPDDCKVTPAGPPQPQPSTPPATLPPSSRNQEQATRLAVLRQLFSALAAAVAAIDAALPTTPAYEAYVKSRQNVMDDTKTALDDADKKLNGASAATDADAIRTDLEQAELWLFFVQYYAQLGALVRSAEHDRLISGVIVSVASEADAYAKAFTLVKTGTPEALTFARTNAMTQVQNTKRLLDTLKGSIAKGQEAVKTAEKVEAVLDVPLKFAAGRAMPVWAVAMTAATQAAGLYVAHTAEFDLITANAGSFLAELKWLNDNAPVTANLVLDPIYVAIGKDALKSVSAADAAFIIGRTMRGLAGAAGKVTVTMVVAVLARCTGIVLFIKSPLLALHGLGKLTEKTKEAALKALGGEADPDHIIRDFNKNFDPPLSAGDVAALLLELNDPARRDHLERLAELGKTMGPAIAVIVSDLKGVGTLTGVTAQAETAAVPLLPPAP